MTIEDFKARLDQAINNRTHTQQIFYQICGQIVELECLIKIWEEKQKNSVGVEPDGQ